MGLAFDAASRKAFLPAETKAISLHGLTHAFFHRRDEGVGNDTAFHRIDELETAAARQRFDAQIDLAELA